MTILTDVNAVSLERIQLVNNSPVALWHGHTVENVAPNHTRCYFIPPHMHDHIKQHCAECLPEDVAALFQEHAEKAAHFRCARNDHTCLLRNEPKSDERSIIRKPKFDGETIQKIYDCRLKSALPGSPVDPKASTDKTVQRAFDAAKKTYNFFLEVFKRDSIDNKGMSVISTVHYERRYGNAFWNGVQMVYGDGDGVLFNDFTLDIDVPGHEITHGVTEHTLGLEYANQSGAINEHISDAFGTMIKHHAFGQTVDQADWLIGDGILIGEGALRSMKNPGTAYDNRLLGKDPQPARMGDYVQMPNDSDNDWGGVHINSGIPNRAFYLICTELGGYSWEKVGRIWYRTLEDRNLKPTASFEDFANSTIASAKSLANEISDWTGKEYEAVIRAWKQVEVL
jgi:Zn-dependent metalloprotease